VFVSNRGSSRFSLCTALHSRISRIDSKECSRVDWLLDRIERGISQVWTALCRF